MVESINTAQNFSPAVSVPTPKNNSVTDRFGSNTITSFPIKPLPLGVRIGNQLIDLFQGFITWLKSLWTVDDRILFSAAGADKKTNYLTLKKREGYVEVVETTFSKPELMRGVFHKFFGQKIAEMNRKGESCFVLVFAPKFNIAWMKETIFSTPDKAKFPDYVFRVIRVKNKHEELVIALRVFKKKELYKYGTIAHF